MFNLCRRVMRYAFYNVKLLKSIHTKYPVSSSSTCHHHSTIFPGLVTPIRTISTKYSFSIKNTTIELQKKLKKLSIRLENGFGISMFSVENILVHPCFKYTKITKADSVILINACNSMYEESSTKRIEYVWRIWEKMKNSGIIDLDSYHLLFRVFRDCGTYIEPNLLLDSLLKNGCSPTSETYTLLLECTCENQNIDGIEFVLSAMKKDGYEASDRCLNAILFATVKRLDSAKDYLRNTSNSLNSGIYTSLLRGIAEQTVENSNPFDEVLSEAREKGIELSLHERILIVQSLIHRTDLFRFIPSVLGPKDHWVPHLMTLCNLIARCLCLKNYPAMFEVFNYMGDLVNHMTPGTDELPPCSYIELIVTNMVRSKMPVNDILRFCFEKDTTARLNRAAYTSLRCGMFTYSLAFFEAMKSVDLPLRPHFFWPIFLSCRNDQQMYNVIAAMNQLNVELDFDTLRTYVLKRLNFMESDVTLKKLEELGIPLSKLATPLLVLVVQRNQLSHAVKLYAKYKSEIDHDKIYFTLASSLIRCDNFDAVSQICSDDIQHLLKVFHNLIIHFKKSAPPSLIEQFLNTFRKNKTNLFKADLEELRIYLKLHHLDEEIWLNNLLNEVNNDASPLSRPHLRDMNIDQLEDYIVHLRKHNYPVRQALRRLLIMHADRGSVDRVVELKQELEENNMEFSMGMKAALMKCFCLNGNFNSAYDLFLDMKSKGFHEKLQGAKYLMLANAAASAGRLEVMYEILKSRTNFQEYDLSDDCLKLIETVTQSYGVQAAEQLLEYLVRNNYCHLKIVLLKPIMQYYLIRNEVENATLACLKYANRYRLMPMKHVIISKLAVLAEEAKAHESVSKFQLLLDKVLRTAGYLYGSSHTNLVYILCMAEMGLLESLKLYLKESYTGTEEKLLWHECNKLSDLNKVKTLMNLERAFKNTTWNMEPIYINLLKIYCRSNDLKSARELLKSLEESQRVPSMEFSTMYSELMNGDDVFLT